MENKQNGNWDINNMKNKKTNAKRINKSNNGKQTKSKKQ